MQRSMSRLRFVISTCALLAACAKPANPVQQQCGAITLGESASSLANLGTSMASTSNVDPCRTIPIVSTLGPVNQLLECLPIVPLTPDAGPNLDAGPAIDAGPVIDAGHPADAGPGYDAGPPVDAGPDVCDAYPTLGLIETTFNGADENSADESTCCQTCCVFVSGGRVVGTAVVQD